MNMNEKYEEKQIEIRKISEIATEYGALRNDEG